MPARPIPSRRRHTTSAGPLPPPTTSQTLTAGPHRIVTLCWSPSGHFLAAALQHGTILIFSTQTSSTAPLRPIPTRMLKGHAADAVHLVFSPSNLLASASIDRSARLWQPATGLCLRRLPHADKVVATAFDPADPSVLLTATANGHARIVRVSDRTILARADAAAQLHAAVMLPQSGSHSSAVLATRDGRLLQWRPQTAVATSADRLLEIPFEPRRTHALARRSNRAANIVPPSLAALPGGRVLMSAGARRAELSAQTGVSHRVRGASSHTQGMALAPGMSPDGRFSLVDAAGSAVRLLDATAAAAAAASHKRGSHASSRESAGDIIEINALRRGATSCCAAFAPDAVLKRVARRSGARSFLLAVGGSDGSIALIEQLY